MVSWKRTKQQTVAQSTYEAEYIALAETVKEAKFLKQLCIDLKVLEASKSVLISVDNQGAIKLEKTPMFHKRSKQIYIKYHFITRKLQIGTIHL